jgi:hypothetical protein
MDPTTARIKAAWDEAQDAFHAMIDANVYGDPNAEETRAYVTAERHLDNLLADAQFAEVQAQLEYALAEGKLIEAAGLRHSMHDDPNPGCAACQEANAAMWERMPRCGSGWPR